MVIKGITTVGKWIDGKWVRNAVDTVADTVSKTKGRWVDGKWVKEATQTLENGKVYTKMKPTTLSTNTVVTDSIKINNSTKPQIIDIEATSRNGSPVFSLFSKKTGCNTQVTITSTSRKLDGFTKYTVKDNGGMPIGEVRLYDIPEGVWVDMIVNNRQSDFKGFGKLADIIEVQHCLNRGMNKFEILSTGNSNQVLHYLRGKRFYNEEYNRMVEEIIKNTPKGQPYPTLKPENMYMPQNVINNYISLLSNA